MHGEEDILSVMLFDLQNNKRHKALQFIYAFLALVMVGGLLLFGIGGAVGGGFLNSLGGSTSSNNYGEVADTAVKKLKQNPTDAALLVAAIRAQYNLGLDKGTNGVPGPKSQPSFEQADKYWQTLVDKHPKASQTLDVAPFMLQVYSSGALNKPAEGQAVADLIAQKRPSAQSYYQLFTFATLAGNDRVAKLAEAQAYKLSDSKAKKAQLKLAIQQFKDSLKKTATTTPETTNTPIPQQ